MNIVLFNKGKNPDYIKVTLSQIKKYNVDINIFFICDDTSNLIDNIYTVKINELNSNFIEFFNKSDFYLNEQNPLWRTSIERFFYIQELVNKFNLENIFHFDNDVLVYNKFENILSKITNESNLITPANENNLVCGMFFTRNSNSLVQITNKLFEKIKIGQFKLNEKYKNRVIKINNEIVENFHLNEMSLLKIIQEDSNCINDFPILPNSNNFIKFNTCFDPSSWGQYLSGTHQDHPPGYYSNHHYIGRYIDKNIYKVKFLDKKPFIFHNDLIKYELFNLHIHSKKLINWV